VISVAAVGIRIPLADAHLPGDTAMKPVIPMFKSALLALTTLFAAPLVVAKDNGEWKVNGDLIGKKDKVAEDLSGIACTTDSGFPRTCLLSTTSSNRPKS